MDFNENNALFGAHNEAGYLFGWAALRLGEKSFPEMFLAKTPRQQRRNRCGSGFVLSFFVVSEDQEASECSIVLPELGGLEAGVGCQGYTLGG